MRINQILKKIKTDYSKIADEFDASRGIREWPEFKVFLKELRKRKKASSTLRVLDVGCGNGRLWHFLTIRQAHGDIGPIDYIGVDNNKKMLQIAKKHAPKARFRFGDVLKLPFPANSFDTVFAIALLHHLPTKKLQLKALKEMKRVLKPGGLLFLTTWNLWQKKYIKYINAKTHHAKIPWGKGKKVLRYYYAFRSAEFKNLLKDAGFHSIKKLSSPHNLAYICF